MDRQNREYPMKGGLLSDKSGFSLIEVMIAICILAFGILAVASLQVSAIRGNSSANRVTAATTLAEQRMEALKSTGFLSLANTSWTSAETIGRFSRQWQITTTGNLKQIDVRVMWTDPLGISRQVNISSYLAR